MMQTTSSHVPILLEVIAQIKPTLALEFGSGYFSTQILLEHVPAVRSIESDPAWHQKLYARFLKKYVYLNRWSYTLCPNNSDHLDAAWGRYDLALVDGSGPSREETARVALSVAPVVVAHDTQYDWVKTFLAPGFIRVDFTQFPVMHASREIGVQDHRPWTSVWLDATLPAQWLHDLKAREPELYIKHRYPYGVELSTP